jgi:F420-dependent oxidoreductase-like protein
VHIGMHIMNFTWPGGPAAIGPTLDRVLTSAEQAGIHSFWPMDHFFQIPIIGEPDQPMLEAYAALAWAAGRTRRIQLGALVTGVAYRHPGALLKAITTLDVLSGGRAWLGIGAAWNEGEARGLGIPFPPLAERFERLEETLRIAHRMFSGDSSLFAGRHYQLDQPFNSPLPVRRPPILIGGGGERKTLRLVAEYADACNLFEGQLAHKLDVLRRHCDAVGRPFEDVVITTTGVLGPTPSVEQAVERFGKLAEQGVDLALIDLPNPFDERIFELFAAVIAKVADLGRSSPPAVTGGPGRALVPA